MKIKKVPMRTCVASKEKLPKKELIRVVRTPNGEIIIDDEKGKANGRGAYLKKSLQVLEKARKSQILNKYLEVEIPNDIFDKLERMIENEKK